MKHAYLIIAHKVDKTLQSLLRLIDDERNDIFLHMDVKNKSFQKESISFLKHSKIYITSSLSVNWGGYSQIKCEILLFETAAKTGTYAYYHLVSGQDLPLKSQDYIHSFFQRHQGKEFIRFQSKDFIFSDRVKYYHLFQEKLGRNKNFSFVKCLNFISIGIQKLLKVNRNKKVKFYKGTNWVSVTDCFVRELLAHKKWIQELFQFTVCCDEVYKQTFAYNYGFKERLFYTGFDNNEVAMVRLIDWKRGNPYVWRIQDKEELLNSEMIFARKFDENVDLEIIEYIENQFS